MKKHVWRPLFHRGLGEVTADVCPSLHPLLSILLELHTLGTWGVLSQLQRITRGIVFFVFFFEYQFFQTYFSQL